jgi:LemA protein
MRFGVLGLVLILALIVALAVQCVGIYKGLVRLRAGVEAAWANLAVLLRQRHDELAKLVDACRRLMPFEQALLDRVLRARASISRSCASGDVAAVGAAERQLRLGLGRLSALTEGYPHLADDAAFKHWRSRIAALEQSIAESRELYNGQVNLNNIRIKAFPDVLIAQKFGFRPAQLLEFSGEDRHEVDAGALLSAS